YERIPWETLEKPGIDRQWWVMGIAAAVVAGALGYSFVSNRPVAPAAVAAEQVTAPPAPVPLPPVAAPTVPPAAPVTTTPQAVAEADLYAVPPDALRSQASAFAEWFVSEYLTADGSADGPATLRSLLPADLPLPEVPDGTLTFVEWVVALDVIEAGPGQFEVDVLARYMVAPDGGAYERLDPEVFTVTVVVDENGPHVVGAPRIRPVDVPVAGAVGFVELPPEVLNAVTELRPDSTVMGGISNQDGSWTVSLVTVGPGGVERPESMVVLP
ncbi:MAG TPA: hypothetical protein VIW94_02945, partial [Acidimicrobiia bacterium]